MVEQDAGRKADHKFAASSAIETGLSQINDPKQGARLVRAFLRITDPMVRLAIVHMVEKIGSSCSCGLLARRPRSSVPSICVAASRSNATSILFMSSPGP
jgi:hypothetical protein